jgi:hypothetical protein
MAVGIVLLKFLYLDGTRGSLDQALDVSTLVPSLSSSTQEVIPATSSSPSVTESIIPPPSPRVIETVATSSSEPHASSTGFPLSDIQLSDEVRSALPLLGIEYETFFVTPAMMQCAQTSLGDARMQAIKGGEQPTWRELVTLRGCL